MAKVLVIFVEVNVSFPTSLICPTEARYLKRRPKNSIGVGSKFVYKICSRTQQCWCSPSFLMKLINGKGIVGSSKQIEELRVDTNAGGRGM